MYNYKEDWNPIGELFETSIEQFNQHDRYAVAISSNHDSDTIGHIPIEISKICYYFLRNGGSICGEVIGKRKKSDVRMKGLEIPCKYQFTSKKRRDVSKLKRLLQNKAFGCSLKIIGNITP